MEGHSFQSTASSSAVCIAMASSLIASINSVLHHLDTNFPHYGIECGVKTELRNLKALLIICFRKLGNSSPSLPSLYSRIQDAIARICLLESKLNLSYDDMLLSAEVVVRCLGKQVDDEWYAAISGPGPLLTVDDIVAIIDSIVDNCHDFPSMLPYFSRYKIDLKVMDRFEVEILFLRNFLVFAKHTGVQLHHFLILIQPFAIKAAHVFVKEGFFCCGRIGDVQSMCSTVNGMATELGIYGAYAQALSTSTRGLQYAGICSSMLIDFLDPLISLFWDVLRCSDSRNDQLIVLYARLRLCRAILKQRPKSFNGKIMDQIEGLIHDAGSFICSLHQTDVEKDLGPISDLLQRFESFDAFEAEIQNMPSQTSESNVLVFGDHSTDINIYHDNENDLKAYEDTQMSSHQPPQSTTSQLLGFTDDEVESVLDRLTRGSNQLRIVPISGMAGIGKTTFALKLYNHRSIMYHFQARAWCTVSQVLDKKKLFVHLLNQINESDSYSKMTEDDLADKLRRCLKGKRYLILLDDVWTLDVWNSLKTSFPDDSNQSRIFLTSRQSDIAPHGQPYSLRLRNMHECFDILQMKLSHEEGWNPIIGKKIAKSCKGLPLTVVIVAGLLATVKHEGWKGILDHLSSGGVSREEQCISALELSYKHLPDDLKLCFLYTGAFPEDEEVSGKSLIRLWIAEGFVKRNSSKTSEDVGREHLENLIKKSLVMVARRRSIGGVKSFRIHDILLDFCRTKAREENSFQLLHGYDQLSDFNQPCCLQRLCIHSRPIHFKKSKLFCPRLHSLLLFSSQSVRNDHSLFDMSFVIQIFKLLKVLDIKFGMVAEIPSEIEFLTRLTYLSVQSYWNAIPFSIGNLSNLETLVADFPRSLEAISFPDTFWNLQTLKYLHINANGGFSLPAENLENSSDMLELEVLSGVLFKSDGSMERQLKKFRNIRTLKCTILPDGKSRVSKIVVPDFLNQLRSLTVSGKGKLQCEFGSTQNLRKVMLRDLELAREEIAVIGKLPNLEVLKLRGISFSGGTLEMEEGDFTKLKIFHLFDYGGCLTLWTASDEQLPSLQKLRLIACTALEEIPSTCLENSPTLEEIEVYKGSSTLESLVRDIEAVHGDFGNFVKVTIASSIH